MQSLPGESRRAGQPELNTMLACLFPLTFPDFMEDLGARVQGGGSFWAQALLPGQVAQPLPSLSRVPLPGPFCCLVCQGQTHLPPAVADGAAVCPAAAPRALGHGRPAALQLAAGPVTGS